MLGFSPFRAIGLRAPVPTWLLEGGPLSPLLQRPPHLALSEQACEKRERERNSEKEGKQDGSYSLLGPMRVTSHHFCCILFIGSVSLGQAHVQGKGSHAHEPQRAGVPGSQFRRLPTNGIQVDFVLLLDLTQSVFLFLNSVYKISIIIPQGPLQLQPMILGGPKREQQKAHRKVTLNFIMALQPHLQK